MGALRVLLRVEGVNLSTFIDDTADLSTMRGASLTLLRTIDAIRETLPGARCLSQGASAGLFEIKVEGQDQARQIRDDLERLLATGGTGPAGSRRKAVPDSYDKVVRLARYGTFTVDVEPLKDDGDFVRASEAVLAANRWRQMQAPCLVPPEAGVKEGEPGERVCNADHVRPANPKKTTRKWGGRPVSDAVHDRRGYGISQKHGLYRQVLRQGMQEDGSSRALPLDFPKSFAPDMAQLADMRREDNLRGKIALLYADGNHFGRLQQAYVEGREDVIWGFADSDDASKTPAERQQRFDKTIRSRRLDLLHALLWRLYALRELTVVEDEIEVEQEQDPQQKRYMRLETQLWGGDELIWVVPATVGAKVASLLFKETADWTIGGRPLTHAVGLVFCHHDAPIARVRQLAHDLAGLCKAECREESRIAYQVLESFDHIGRDLAGFRQERSPPGIRPHNWILTPMSWDCLQKVAEGLHGRKFPRRRLRALAQSLYGEGVGPAFDEVEQAAFREVAGSEAIVEELRKALGPAMWLHLEELWDYLTVDELMPKDAAR